MSYSVGLGGQHWLRIKCSLMAARNSSDSFTPLRAASSLNALRISGTSRAWIGESSAGKVCPKGRPIFGLFASFLRGSVMVACILFPFRLHVKRYRTQSYKYFVQKAKDNYFLY